MKFRITLKDPDGFSDGVADAVNDALGGADAGDREALFDLRTERAWKALDKFVEYQEYVTIEFDIDAGTAVVVPRS